ncbi:MAG: Gfo/Idh/MocA family oxidoreductase [SAR202 cluster bacterium]|nr:Gfo/Idh/MocA family oxidoreductase [SAR202 cluster bacterium]
MVTNNNRIRLGVVGASVKRGWAKNAHMPAIPHLPEFELAAVCTSRPETVAESAKAYGARLAFHDYHAMAASPEVDAVAVSVRTPMHREITLAALRAKKPVFTEWPLGRNITETEEIAAAAAKSGLPAVVGLQGRVGPANLYVRDLVREGFVGKVLSAFIYRITPEVVPDKDTVWGLEKDKGATSLTIAAGHTLDTLAFILGEFRELSSYVTVQHSPLQRSDTKEMVKVTAPDHVMVQGILESGAAASVYVCSSVPGFVSGGRLEVYGTEGMLVSTSPESLHRGTVTVAGSKGYKAPSPMPIPDKYQWAPKSVPAGAPLNVAQLYRLWSKAIQGEKPTYPSFQDAARRYRMLEAVVKASETGTRVRVG